jgi:hypothetical protein
MSVIKSKRSISKLEFYHNARVMRQDITELLRRDFGIHSRGNAKQVDQNLPDDYYDEDLRDLSRSIKALLRNLMMNITGGNTIYPTNLEDTARRRYYQNQAIINCEQLHQEFLFCEDTLPLKASKLAPYIEKIEFEIKLLKGWRKSTNKFESDIKQKEAAKTEQIK